MKRITAGIALVCVLAGAGCQTTQKEYRLIGDPPMPPFKQTAGRLQWVSATPPPEPPPPKPVQPPKPAPARARTLAGATIIVDPGHGGHDPGALGRGTSAVPEKDLVLAIGNELAEELAAGGARVIQTRNSDHFVTLDGRAAMADQYQVDLFVSVHADSAGSADASGATVYIGVGRQTRSRQAAQCIHSALESAGIDCRGMRQKRLRVCMAHHRPALLIECGYISNAHDASQLNSPQFRSRLAQAITKGISDYFARYASAAP